MSALLLTGCGDKKVSATADNLPTVTTNQGEAPTIGAPSGTPPTTLVTKDFIVGTGAQAQPTSTMTVHYTLMSWSNGKVVESSWTSGSPATFPLANVIVGWQQGIPGMKVGGRRLLVIPPDLGYGAQGGGPIGPNETLIFVVDAIGVA
jgi:peptidylprolyl isomerase